VRMKVTTIMVTPAARGQAARAARAALATDSA
jgi:hypothetical protein